MRTRLIRGITATLVIPFMVLWFGVLKSNFVWSNPAKKGNTPSTIQSKPRVEVNKGPIILKPSAFGVSKPLSWVSENWHEIVKPPTKESLKRYQKIQEMLPLPLPLEKLHPPYKPSGQPTPPPKPEPLKPATTTPAPLASFEGMNNYDNVIGGLFQVLPPDVNGDVGESHYVETVNLMVRIYSKSGSPLTPPFPMSALFASAGLTNSPCSQFDDGDPVVLYDQLAGRWFIAQFYISDVFSGTGPSHYCIAVSKTSDPTGEYYAYDFVWPDFPSNPANAHLFMDYPHHAIWPDTVWVTAHEFDITRTICPDVFCGQAMVGLEKQKMLLGDPNATMVYFGSQAIPPSGLDLTQIGGVLAADLEGMVPPPDGTPGIFLEWLADEYGSPADAVNVYKFMLDWTNPANADIILDTTLTVASFDPTNPSGREDIPQPPNTSTPGLDSLASRFMHRIVFRNMGSHSLIAANHTVCVSTDCTTFGNYRAGIRWYLLKYDHNTGAVTVQDQGTYAPADSDSRWMGSLTLDNAGNLCLSYTKSSTSTYPTIAYTCRAPSDPPGSMGTEEILVSGSASQTNTSSRWGDYSMISIDPIDDCTFWPIHEYYSDTNPTGCSSTACWHTRFGFFRHSSCTAPPTCTIQGKVLTSDTGIPVPNALVTFTPSGGSSVVYTATTTNLGLYAKTLPPGVYDVGVTAPGIAPFTPVTVDCSTPGGSVNQDLYPDGLGIPQSLGFTYVDSCPFGGPGNNDGIIDPGENVTIIWSLYNNGFGNIMNATGTLSTPSTDLTVTDPSGSWPTIKPSEIQTTNNHFGLSVRKNAVCGNNHTLNLNVTHSDGAANFSQTLPVGTFINFDIFSENFDSGIPSTWTVINGGACPATWVENSTSSCPHDLPSPFSGDFPIVDSDCAGFGCGSMDESLISPSIDVSSCILNGGSVFLSFSNDYCNFANIDTAEVDVSIDGGTTWQNVVSWNDDVNCDINQTVGTQTFDITSLVSANPFNIQLRFHYFHNDDFLWWWAIDNVTLTCVMPKCTICGEGTWFIWDVGSNTFGISSDTPVPADYNGDGSTEQAVFRPSTGEWLISGGGSYTFGTAGDIPVPADYNGDGKAEIAVFRPSSGQWFIFGVGTFTFGTTGDIPVPADYNGDGKAEIAVFRPSSGQWFIFGVGTFTFGTTGDIPVPADYNGDGKANISIFRP